MNAEIYVTMAQPEADDGKQLVVRGLKDEAPAKVQLQKALKQLV